MQVTISIRLTPFGQVSLQVGKVPPIEKEQDVSQSAKQPIRYTEPATAGLRDFQILYEQESRTYIIPQTTG